MNIKKYKVITISDFVNFPPLINEVGWAVNIDAAKQLIDSSSSFQHLIVEFDNSSGWIVYAQPKKQ